jgi:predicted dithiol-disulfide oxidoreductase (DUF899 family)
MHGYRFPGETAEYRAARDELLLMERDLRRQTERVAAARRKLPMGARVPEDYVFEEHTGAGTAAGGARKVRLSELFAPGKDTLLLYGFMYGPDDEACPMCTSFLDGLNGNATHITQRVNLAVTAKSPIARVQAHADARGWRHLRMLSWGGTKFGADYHCEIERGAQNSIMHVFARRPDGIHHFWSTELNLMEADPGQNQRHIDVMWPVWNALDTTPEGRGSDWYPSLSYK